MAETLLITGASGRLGGALTRALGKDFRIAQLSLTEPGDAALRQYGPVFAGSVTDPDIVARAMDGASAVIHCASFPGPMEPFTKLMETNVQGTFVVLEEAGRRAEVERFVFVSSIHWHGLHEQRGGVQIPEFLPVTEAQASRATGYFDTSKVLAERLVETYAKRFQKPAVALRPAWIIGADLQATFKAMPPVEGPHLNDYVGMDDVIRAVRLALDYDPPEGFDAFLLHAEDQRSTLPSRELAERYYPAVPVDLAKLETCGGYGALVDCAHAKERLGWTPKFRCAR